MAQLAINGGPKAIASPIGSPWPVYDEREKQALIEVLESRRWGRSLYGDPRASRLWKFEHAFAEFHDTKYGVALASGTTALETCLRAVGVEAGDEVIVPAFTYIASASCILQCNGVPVFADVDPRNYTIDPQAVEAAVTPRTRAVVAVDFGGMPCDTDALRGVCEKHGLALVSDCAHAHAGQWRGKGVGSWADIAAFSCMPGKTFAIGEGAVVTTNREDLYEKAFRYHYAGRLPDDENLDFAWPATTLRLSEWEAAIGLVGLTRLEEQAETRWRNARYLGEGLREIPGLEPLEIDPRVTRWNPFRWHFKFVREEFQGVHRDVFRKALAAEGLPAGIGPTKPLYTFSMFASGRWGRTDCPVRCPLYKGRMDYSKVRCPEAERIHAEEALDLGHRFLLGPQEDMDRILDAMRKVREHADELKGIEP